MERELEFEENLRETKILREKRMHKWGYGNEELMKGRRREEVMKSWIDKDSQLSKRSCEKLINILYTATKITTFCRRYFRDLDVSMVINLQPPSKRFVICRRPQDTINYKMLNYS